MDIKRRLNTSQFAAVTTTDGPLLVIAGAGSGKTRVIEYRVLYLVEKKVNPHSILLLTFTRSSAREMIYRAARHDPRCKDVEGGTFHSFAYKHLKKYAKVMGLTESFSLLDEGDSGEAIYRCATKLGLYDKEKRYPKKGTLRMIISMSLNKGMAISEVLKKEYPHFLEYTDDIENLRKEYAAYKIDKNYLDYDDLLVFLRILLENEEILDRISRRFKYIMVDEYQDTNRLQGDISFLLAKKQRNIMIVGDDAQSIYGFRGASHENIMEFPRKFPECKIIKLEENYRSTQAVLDVANAVLENMKNKYSKCLVSAKMRTGEKPCLFFFRDSHEEAEWVADRIKSLRDEGVLLSQQSVLFRSQYLSIPLQAELSRRNIPFEVFGGLKFYETAHVKDVVAHLKILVNPRDELAWSRVLTLIDGVGPRTSEHLSEEILGCASFTEILDGVFRRHDKGYRYSDGLARLGAFLRAVRGQGLNVGEQFALVLEYYIPLLKDRFDDWHLRMNDLETLRQVSSKYSSPEDFLEDFVVEPPERGVWRVEPSTPDDDRPLTLSTIHSAKGLEWECVFLIGLMDGVLPVAFALDQEDELEEEQRLFYVGITRAKNRLFLSLHHEGFRGGITQFNKMSRFIDVPNVMSKLSTCVLPEGERMVSGTGFERGSQLFDKQSLLKRVIDLSVRKVEESK
ncbi:MAG TPA: ATP-dependent helicase [Thermodesulfovibrionales bacterium]|nr:ATP-dependent helicase [Thermodesulfovibrionales bacterium]